jgi:hypothetical protein
MKKCLLWGTNLPKRSNCVFIQFIFALTGLFYWNRQKRVAEEGRVLAVKQENDKLEKDISELDSEQFELQQEKEELKMRLQETQDTDVSMGHCLPHPQAFEHNHTIKCLARSEGVLTELGELYGWDSYSAVVPRGLSYFDVVSENVFE